MKTKHQDDLPQTPNYPFKVERRTFSHTLDQFGILRQAREWTPWIFHLEYEHQAQAVLAHKICTISASVFCSDQGEEFPYSEFRVVKP